MKGWGWTAAWPSGCGGQATGKWGRRRLFRAGGIISLAWAGLGGWALQLGRAAKRQGRGRASAPFPLTPSPAGPISPPSSQLSPASQFCGTFALGPDLLGSAPCPWGPLGSRDRPRPCWLLQPDPQGRGGQGHGLLGQARAAWVSEGAAGNERGKSRCRCFPRAGRAGRLPSAPACSCCLLPRGAAGGEGEAASGSQAPLSGWGPCPGLPEGLVPITQASVPPQLLCSPQPRRREDFAAQKGTKIIFGLIIPLFLVPAGPWERRGWPVGTKVSSFGWPALERP